MSENGQWLGFVNVDLTATDKKEVKKDNITVADLFDWLVVEIAQGPYKFSFGHDEERQCYVATLTAKGLDNPNCGYSMSQRHSKPEVALKALWYAHEIKLERNWAGASKQQPLRFDW